MAIAITCPSCKHSGRVPDTAVGRKIRCPKCGTPFLIEADGAAPLTPPPAPSVPEPPPLPPPQQQPLPSAFDLPPEPEPPATIEPPPPAPAPIDAPPAAPPAVSLPWYYDFLETYTRVATIAGITMACIWLLVYVGVWTMGLVASGGQGILIALPMLVVALIVFAAVILGILLAAALIFLLVDMGRNLRDMRRTIEDRAQHGS